MRLCASTVASWPPLAWCARLPRGGDQLDLQCGRMVETQENWFAEAVWDGSFGDADFDQTDLIFGSGARQRDGVWTFVSAGSTVDRLQWIEVEGTYFVSNSLACLMSVIDAQVDPHFDAYFSLFESIIQGIADYQRTLPSSAGDIHLTYFRDLQFDGQTLREIEKPFIKRQFQTFADYESFLIDAMKAIGDNLADPLRTNRLSPIASVSTGYDSPTAATMARHAGLKETLSIKDSREGVDDDGSEIAKHLGLTPVNISRDQWRSSSSSLDPTRFIASDAKGEDVYFAPAAEVLSQRVLFTGYSGSRIWDATVADYANIRRGDQSGLSHTEARLHAGYLHVPVPFFAALQENDLRALGATKEMQPWSVGGDYNRPLCRRIVEQAGVPREAFGQEKKAASVLLFDRGSFLPADRKAEFQQWLIDNRVGKRDFTERMLTATRDAFKVRTGQMLDFAQRTLLRLDSVLKLPVVTRLAHSGRITQMARYEPQFDHIFPWALAETMKAYQVVESH